MQKLNKILALAILLAATILIFEIKFALGAEASVQTTITVRKVVTLIDESGEPCFYAPEVEKPWNGNAYSECPEGIEPLLNGEAPLSAEVEDGTLNIM